MPDDDSDVIVVLSLRVSLPQESSVEFTRKQYMNSSDGADGSSKPTR